MIAFNAGQEGSVIVERIKGMDRGWGYNAATGEFVDMVQASIGVIRRPLPFTAMGRGVAGRNFLVDYFTPMVPIRRESQGQDIFTQFCQARDENGDYLPVDAIVDHMNFLMMAAHDTITSSVTSMVWLLAKHPEWQDRLPRIARRLARRAGSQP